MDGWKEESERFSDPFTNKIVKRLLSIYTTSDDIGFYPFFDHSTELWDGIYDTDICMHSLYDAYQTYELKELFFVFFRLMYLFASIKIIQEY